VGATLVRGDVDVNTPADNICAQSYTGAYVDANANCQ
jgi:hypothetical protein